ncbi:MAG: TRAFAC clade GTPase domain-containing protein [Ktedonobacterales bacterium]
MSFLSRDLVCPFCFTAFGPWNIRFRCIFPGCTGLAPDAQFAKYRGGIGATMGRVLAPAKPGMLDRTRVPASATCDTCQQDTRTRLCPECHFQLAHDIGQVDQRIIAIIGGRNTGKSHYIVTLLNRLQNEVGANFNFSVLPMTDESRSRWLNEFYNPLYESKNVLPATAPAAVNVQVKSPLIFRLTLGEAVGRRVLNLSFFDTAGEDMKSLDTMSIQAKYITHADGIVFLLDPLQIPYVRDRLGSSANLPTRDDDSRPDFIVQRLIELFERQGVARARDTIKTPIAFALSKVDALSMILDASSALQNPGEHFGQLDLRDVRDMSGEIANYLRSWIGAGFCNVIEQRFANFNYFGVSSLGEPPVPGQPLRAIRPFRVEDPFLWILYQFNLIKAAKGR